MKRAKVSVRIGTLLLAATLFLGDAIPAMAMQTNTQFSNAVEETKEISVSDGNAEEVTEETVSAGNPVDVELERFDSLTGPSKVIGLEANPYYYNSWMDKNGVVRPYIYVDDSENENVIAAGAGMEAFEDDATALYTYGGAYFTWIQETSVSGYYKLGGLVHLLSGAKSDYLDAATNLYLVNGTYYRSIGRTSTSQCYYKDADRVEVVGVYETSDAFTAKHGVNADSDDAFEYYAVNGKCYTQYSYKTVNSQRVYYAWSEISFTEHRVRFSWNYIRSNENYDSQGRAIKVGYEVLINGKHAASYDLMAADASNNIYPLTTEYSDNDIYTSVTLKAGESVTAKVRALYYYAEETKDEDGDTVTKYVVTQVGEWSDELTYTAPTILPAPAVTNLRALQEENNIQLSWDYLEMADSFFCRIIKSATPLNITDYASFYQYYNNNDDTLDIVTDYEYYYASWGEAVGDSYTSVSSERPYMYFVIQTNGVPDGYYGVNSWSNVAAVTYVPPVDASKTPDILDFKLVSYENGETLKLEWEPVDADVAIYAFAEGKNYTDIPYFNYYKLNARRVDTVAGVNGTTTTKTTYLKNKLSGLQMYAINRYVLYISGIDGNDGYYNVSKFRLRPGVKYNFVAFTYDDSSDIKPLIGTELDEAGFNQYTSFSNPSATVAYTKKLLKPSVSLYAKEDSVKLTMSASGATGYKIYRKEEGKKKYTKIATTTDSYYLDEGLKTGKRYSYKVEAYYYNPLTKKTCTSAATYKSTITVTDRDLVMYASKASKTSVKLKWNKVKSATKYEIYRTTDNEDMLTINKYMGTGDYLYTLNNYKFDLIKTITNASTTTYTDKNLNQGETYTYVVLAYYKDGSKTGHLYYQDQIELQLEAPQNVTGTVKKSAVTVTWDADKFASKYEIRYKIMDKYGNYKTDDWQEATTKKAKYTIKLSSGEYVVVQVRAYGQNKSYSSWSEVEAINSLAVPTNIKAVNDTKKDAVKITWKKVSGAKYYKVYRSTKMGVYNATDNKYEALGDYIAKEANDNTYQDAYSNNIVNYSDYYEISGSIVGTKAYDYAKLEPGVKYYYYVVAFGERGTEIASYTATSNNYMDDYASGKPASVVAAADITIKLANKKAKKVTISYNKVQGAKSYKIFRATKKNGEYKLLKSTNKTTFTDTTAKKGKTYYYKVIATGTNGLKADLVVESAVKSIKVKK